MAVSERTVHTSHADISVAETSGKKAAILLVHGNSSCKEVFRNQLNGPLGEEYRLIAMDLPGHGKSADAVNPERTYCWPGYAETAIEVLEGLGIKQAAVYGWSLGGHAAIEMIPRFPGLAGLMISGTPPVSMTPESIQTGFRANPAVALFGKAEWSDEEVNMLAQGLYGPACDDILRNALKRTDGRSRTLLFASLWAGKASDQKALAETAPMPLAIVDGADDPVVNTGYIAGLKIRNLWEGHYHLLRGLGHVAFLTAPETFNPIFARFARDMALRAAEGQKKTAARSQVAAA